MTALHPEIHYREKQVLAKFAPVHRATWWRWIKQGSAPPPVKLGPHVRAWRESDLLSWQQGDWPRQNPPSLA
ncbi:MAG: AlpA family phage regulatory protein [Burkholderiaceae bacterium]|nr:AlpA family phage regulatory protein [Burkholderiaceae bacterium]